LEYGLFQRPLVMRVWWVLFVLRKNEQRTKNKKQNPEMNKTIFAPDEQNSLDFRPWVLFILSFVRGRGCGARSPAKATITGNPAEPVLP